MICYPCSAKKDKLITCNKSYTPRKRTMTMHVYSTISLFTHIQQAVLCSHTPHHPHMHARTHAYSSLSLFRMVMPFFTPGNPVIATNVLYINGYSLIMLVHSDNYNYEIQLKHYSFSAT